MSKIKVIPSKASGDIIPPPSKSLAHRLIICASLAKGTSTIRNIHLSDDIVATLDSMKCFGVSYTYNDNSLKIDGVDMFSAQVSSPLYCNESASTLRFLVPLCLLSNQKITRLGSTSKNIGNIATLFGFSFSEISRRVINKRF